MRLSFYNLWRDEAGVSTVEYALLLALVTVSGIGAWRALGTAVRNTLTQVSTGFGTPLN